MNTQPPTPDNNENLSDLGRAMLASEAARPGSKPSGAWMPPTAEELQKELPQYQITKMLGRGGMGAVYMGRQTSLDRPVAIKILSGALEEADRGFTERFKNEARAMAKLNHPGIVGVFDFGETASGLLYIVMEFVDGTDVAKMIAKEGRLHTEHAMAITAHVCDALSYAHERGIIHRDIKPANIMVGYDGVVKVADFGLAKVSASGATSGLTQSNVVMGTLHYMAPEALLLGSAVDHRADIYAVGVMLYQMLTGKIPQGMFELPSLQVKGLDPRYDGIIAKALREDRDKRYASATELRHDLDAILTQPVVKVEEHASQAPAALPTMARPQRPGGQPYRPPQPRQDYAPPPKKGSGAWVVAFAALAALGWIGWKQMFPPSPVPKQSGAEILQPASVETASTSPSPAAPPPATTTNPAEATKDRPFVNSLGMKFVPVPGTKVLFCIHETRIRDYRTYAEQEAGVDTAWKRDQSQGVRIIQEPDHPVVLVSWQAAKNFCDWVSRNEKLVYRLPTDREWSVAAGIGAKEDASATPAALTGTSLDYPWGKNWPPPNGFANFADDSATYRKSSDNISGYMDGFPYTAPVMSFAPNNLGIFDLAGNVCEACEDWMDEKQAARVWRGGSYGEVDPAKMLWSFRLSRPPGYVSHHSGFRVVIEQSTASFEQSTASPLMPAPSPQANAAPLVPANSPKESSTDQGRGPIDVLALIDPIRDAFNGTWKKTTDGFSLVGDGNMQIPYSPPQEYDFEVEFSISSDSVGVVAQQIRFEGKPITWIMSGQAPGFKPRFGFGPVSGVSPNGESEVSVFSDVRFSKGVRYRSLVQVRKDSLTGLLDGKQMVAWKADATRIPTMRIPTLRPDRQLAFNAKDGSITFHKATITEFLPQPSVAPSLPTGPTTWSDTKGRSITATFKAIASGNVLLDIAGKMTPVPLNTLSPESQKLARAYHDQSNPATTNDPAQATKDRPFVNSLGMNFVPVPGTKVLFCIHETRRVDYSAFAKANPGVGGNWETGVLDDKPLVGEPFDHHPVAKVSRPDAEAFCKWLTAQSRHRYRLPTDAEWSVAAGFDEPRSAAETPYELHNKAVSGAAARIYPWGTEWPPPSRAGNYSGQFTPAADNFPTTAPVMTFQANEHGLYDLGGNLREWVSDRFWNKDQIHGTLRGGAWSITDEFSFRSGCRFGGRIGDDVVGFGFRVVLELPTISSAPTVPQPKPAIQASAPGNPTPATSLASATKDRPFVNSLGMKFVPVPGTKVLMCIHETRRMDYAKYAEANRNVSGRWKTEGVREQPGFVATDTHPVFPVNWDEAKGFCAWIGGKETLTYRLPTDREWSFAVGIAGEEDENATPDQLHGKISINTWGTQWPPLKTFGNFAPKVAGYDDGFEGPAPVMSFVPNELGLHDLGGNVSEWCEDWFDATKTDKVLRGIAWYFGDVTKSPGWFASYRHHLPQNFQGGHNGRGFRVVLELPTTSTATPPATSTSTQSSAMSWKPLRPSEHIDSRDISIRGRFKSGQFAALTVRGSEAGEKPKSKYWAALQTNGQEVVLFREWRNPGPGDSRFANSTLARTTLKQAIPKNREYTLTFTAVGDQLKVLVDDVPVIDLVDKMLPGTFAGFLGDQTPRSLEWMPAPAP